eukprot:CAMPEP_0174254140 /NCGR_PEP_ID=MMETSP0439-20130205/3489_1 /TAXON_ID=0 /ORGANISM="Stereomyxa ramosa, Strain Chinc5" /LENGTH=162 /DNA_ID=CAMNT_0015335577 /DNA_START=62 /DNA_END=550 /DNA_ORIENTATION=-
MRREGELVLDMDYAMSFYEEYDEMSYEDRFTEPHELEFLDDIEEEDDEMPSLILAQFHQGNASESLRQLTNFTLEEFHELWNLIHHPLTTRSSRGREPMYEDMDRFILMLVQLKHKQKWNLFARTWEFKTAGGAESSFQKMLSITGPGQSWLIRAILELRRL